jgi:S-DNA-T family DNA segregation ATPase FtsK/SpoIIIE
MATRRRTSTSRQATPRRRRRNSGLPTMRMPAISPEIARSIVGITFLLLGAVTLIALLLPGEGELTDRYRDSIAPWFETGRWLLPFLLLSAGWYLEWGPGRKPNSGWGATVIGLTLAFVGFLGCLEVLSVELFGVERGGGRIGRFLEELLVPLVTGPGAFILLVGLIVIGLMIAFALRPAELARPFTGTARWLGGVTAASMKRESPAAANGGSTTAAAAATATAKGRRGTGAVGGGTSEGQTGIWGQNGDPATSIPVAIPSPTPTSATFAPARAAGAAGAAAVATGPRPRPLDDITEAGDSAPTREAEYRLPETAVLDDIPLPTNGTGEETIHRHNEEIIKKKLAGFGIPAEITGRNAGPVVTQYEVQPAPDIKVSRIEALADDLAMALAARSLRIEAPIPGKSAVGIEIPNKDFNIVALRRILDELDFEATGSKLTFALGRDVAGKAQAVDLARMPHLLIAGATGSGKSVMVNALITSLLCEATPNEVRLILMDLKRVELAAYNGLPHLLVPVITEPEKAKAALNWAVNEMEGRYRRLAGATARNIRAFNETRVDPADRMPYIVIVIDELADLMMREGKNVEDPIVRLAQKARAVGIHMVLATQRPSVNVVTGLIKANFPSRIAFAMASQIDSRTILDAPGAEDLIGRGDMLYQPSDLPRPIRMQGVFVSDPEIGRVVQHWKDQIDDPHYDLTIIETGDEGTGHAGDADDAEADRLLPDAIEVIREYDRASASLLQRRLKVGYARAARMIDQLEARGYIGAFDGSNARAVLRRDGPSPSGAGDDFDGEDE